jgi:ABC-2 type transport system permease protein
MLKALRLYFGFTKIAIRTNLAHRSAFWAGFFGQWFNYGTMFATLYIVVSTFNILAGWTADEMIFLYAMNLLSYAVAATFFFNPCTGLAAKIRTGEFDIAMTKPLSPFGHELYLGFNVGYVSHISLSIGIMIFASLRVGLSFSLLGALTFIGMLLGAILVQASVLIAVSATSFFVVTDNPAFELSFNIKRFTQYPINIYPVFLQILLTCVLPIAFMDFYPASAILHKDNAMLFPAELSFFTPAVGLALFVLSLRWWNYALSQYQSSGT